MFRQTLCLCVAASLLTAGAACGGGDDDSVASPTIAPTAGLTGTPEPVDASGIYIVELETRDVTQVPLEAGNYFGPSWSPDGTKIAYSFFADIWIANVDGSDVAQVTENGCTNYLPAWSPDGGVLLFVTSCTGEESGDELARINIDGTGETRLTHDAAWDYRGDWSADGSTIMGGSEQDIGWQIFTMKPDGTAQTPLATGAHGNAVSWSRDGLVAITSNRDGDDEIFVMNPDGSEQRNLTNNSDHDDNSAWSPDGSQIAFSSDRTGKNEIFVMDADGSNVRQLTDDARLWPNTPTWSADGLRIAFSADAVGEDSTP